MEDKISTIKLVTVTNRDNGGVTCLLSNNKAISFNAGETKRVPLDDFIELKSTDGGAKILRDYLVINDKEALEILGLDPEPEYYYSKEDIKKLLSEGSLDQLEDCLNFAPEGIIDLLKDIALEIELPDSRKRALIKDKIGFNIDNILLVNKELKTESLKDAKKDEDKVRKATPIETEKSPKRKSAPISQAKEPKIPDYKVISN